MSQLELTKEQREQLKPYERHLFTALKARFVVALAQRITVGVLWPIYIEVYKNNPGSYTCNQCVIDVCAKLGRLYFTEGTPEPEKPIVIGKQPREGQKEPRRATLKAEVDKVPTKAKRTQQKAKKGAKAKGEKK